MKYLKLFVLLVSVVVLTGAVVLVRSTYDATGGGMYDRVRGDDVGQYGMRVDIHENKVDGVLEGGRVVSINGILGDRYGCRRVVVCINSVLSVLVRVMLMSFGALSGVYYVTNILGKELARVNQSTVKEMALVVLIGLMLLTLPLALGCLWELVSRIIDHIVIPFTYFRGIIAISRNRRVDGGGTQVHKQLSVANHSFFEDVVLAINSVLSVVIQLSFIGIGLVWSTWYVIWLFGDLINYPESSIIWRSITLLVGLLLLVFWPLGGVVIGGLVGRFISFQTIPRTYFRNNKRIMDVFYRDGFVIKTV